MEAISHLDILKERIKHEVALAVIYANENESVIKARINIQAYTDDIIDVIRQHAEISDDLHNEIQKLRSICHKHRDVMDEKDNEFLFISNRIDMNKYFEKNNE